VYSDTESEEETPQEKSQKYATSLSSPDLSMQDHPDSIDPEDAEETPLQNSQKKRKPSPSTYSPAKRARFPATATSQIGCKSINLLGTNKS
jgi:hypothetical protein